MRKKKILVVKDRYTKIKKLFVFIHESIFKKYLFYCFRNVEAYFSVFLNILYCYEQLQYFFLIYKKVRQLNQSILLAIFLRYIKYTHTIHLSHYIFLKRWNPKALKIFASKSFSLFCIFFYLYVRESVYNICDRKKNLNLYFQCKYTF